MRQREARRNKGEKTSALSSANLAELKADSKSSSNGKARDAVAKITGMGHSTLSKATEVVEAAEADPEKFGDLPAKMDEKSVNAAYENTCRLPFAAMEAVAIALSIEECMRKQAKERIRRGQKTLIRDRRKAPQIVRSLMQMAKVVVMETRAKPSPDMPI